MRATSALTAISAVVFGSAVLAGCAADVGPSADPAAGAERAAAQAPAPSDVRTDTEVRSETPGPDGDPRYTETAVHVAPDGSMTVTQRAISLSDELRENAQRRSEASAPAAGRSGERSVDAVTVDSACAGSSLWLYDQADDVGNRICFDGSGVIDLRTLDYSCGTFDGIPLCATWSTAKRSYWAGASSGDFAVAGDAMCTAFSSYAAQGTLTSCETQAHLLYLDDMSEVPQLMVDWAGSAGSFYVFALHFTPGGEVDCSFPGGFPTPWKSPWNDGADDVGNAGVYTAVNTAAGGAAPCNPTIACTDVATGRAASITLTNVCPTEQRPSSPTPEQLGD